MDKVAYKYLLYIILLVFAGDVLFTSGFMLLRIPPVGPGIPINEVAIVIGMLAIAFSRLDTHNFLSSGVAFALIPFWLLAGVQLLVGTMTHGFWAIRDAANTIESSFLFIGYCLASDPRFEGIFLKFMRALMWMVAIYVLLYPLQDFLANHSPTVPSMSGYKASLLFSFVNTTSVGVVAVCYLLLDQRGPSWLRLLLAAMVIMWLIVFVQARITYLQLAFLIMMFLFLQPRRLGQFAGLALVAVVLIGLFLASGIEIPGRLGHTFSLEFLTNHIEAIWGGGGAITKDAAEGVDLRLRWWMDIHDRLMKNGFTWLTGLGYGIPLTTFRGLSNDIVREPHNSYFSIYGRLGLVGILLFMALHISVMWSALKLVLKTRKLGLGEVNVIACTIICFLGVHLIYATGEGGFEVSFIAVPYYFLAGVTVAWERKLRSVTAPADLAGAPAYRHGRFGAAQVSPRIRSS